ncbi:MAG: hypothetical protein CTY18_02910 [Methylomonas sp.]|nr:MAG: hypothetical protein CTY18_02910 [Methylomonas sp.]
MLINDSEVIMAFIQYWVTLIFNWVFQMLIALDRLSNAFAFGNSKSTVSARVGYNALKVRVHKHRHYWARYWLAMETLIDFTFYPLDGPGHCLNALEDDCEHKHELGFDFVRILLTLVIVPACVVLIPINWALGWAKNACNA